MKAFIRALTAIAMISSAHADEPASMEQKVFIVNFFGTGVLIAKCDGYQVVDGGMLKLGDRLGLDGQLMGDAILAAIGVHTNTKYNRADLIPRVTQSVVGIANSFSELTNKKNINKFCKEFGETLVANELVERVFDSSAEGPHSSSGNSSPRTK